MNILTDVSCYVSAEEYLYCIVNKKRSYYDPYAPYSYIQLIQTLLFYDRIYVSHPTLNKRHDMYDYGNKPQLLNELFKKI